MSQEKNHPVMMDVTGRVLSLEQRVKGLQGRIAAIETRLSLNGVSPVCTDSRTEDFVPASRRLDRPSAADGSMPGGHAGMTGHVPHDDQVGMARATKPGFNLSGIIAGGIMMGAGFLLLTGNVEIIKNPLVAMGCGIILMAGSINRKAYK